MFSIIEVKLIVVELNIKCQVFKILLKDFEKKKISKN